MTDISNANMLTASEAVRLIRDGRLTSEALVRACLERIEEREPEVGAWAYLNPRLALEQARALDRSSSGGMLHGIPVGFKDICDTHDMPTAYGSRAWSGHRPARDATCVALSRKAGGVVLGKTVSTEFAGQYPGTASNPHDRRRTPGGSSSGSAAAVADYMVPLAVGTQTGGSVIRPASYCGAYGYKPTFGLFSFEGVRHGAETFDTLGFMARSLDDICLYRDVLLGLSEATAPKRMDRFPKIGFCRTPIWDQAEPAAQRALEDAVKTLEAQGAILSDWEMGQEYAATLELMVPISAFEYTRNATMEWRHQPENLSRSMIAMKNLSDSVTLDAYIAALQEIERLRYAIQAALNPFDAIVTLAANGEAPLGLSSTGPTPFTVLWHALGLPSLTLPALKGANGLPIGLQVVAVRHADEKLIAVAGWIRDALRLDKI